MLLIHTGLKKNRRCLFSVSIQEVRRGAATRGPQAEPSRATAANNERKKRSLAPGGSAPALRLGSAPALRPGPARSGPVQGLRAARARARLPARLGAGRATAATRTALAPAHCLAPRPLSPAPAARSRRAPCGGVRRRRGAHRPPALGRGAVREAAAAALSRVCEALSLQW